MDTFYKTWNDVKNQNFDGFIITGAPIEDIPFQDVKYWKELQKIFDWLVEKKISTFHVCWAGQAALYHFYKIPKYKLKHKIFGIFKQKIIKPSNITCGMDDSFYIPISRHTENKTEDIKKIPELKVIITSEETGLCLVKNTKHNHFYIFNHLEYTSETLKKEYLRDCDKRDDVLFPKNYFPKNNINNPPVNIWRANGHAMYKNWIQKLYKTKYS